MKYLVDDIEFENMGGIVVEVDDNASELNDEEFDDLIIAAIIEKTGVMVYGFGGIEPFEDEGDK